MDCEIQSVCGGCPLMPWPVAVQHAEKRGALERALKSFGVEPPAVGLTPSPKPVGYRNRIRLRIDPPGQVRFFNEHKAPSCAVLEPGMRRRLGSLLALSAKTPRLFESFRHLELRSDDSMGKPGLTLGGVGPLEELRERSKPLETALNEFLVGVRGDPEIGCQKRWILDFAWTFVPLDGFLQVNSEVNGLLVRALQRGAVARGARTALDLYAGSGNFSLPLARAGLRVQAVEAHAPSVRALLSAAALQGLGLEALADSAHAACLRAASAGRDFDLVIIDAPRAGARDAMAPVLALLPRTIAICSCNAETLARDIAALAAGGFQLDELMLFDMFPHTRHAEILAWLSRTRRSVD